jgi:hypothetical protein
MQTYFMTTVCVPLDEKKNIIGYCLYLNSEQ